MPDLKFKNAKFLFSALSDSSASHPLFVPRINNPNFIDPDTFTITSPPGIVQLLNGDLGITEMIMGKILSPILATIGDNELVARQFAAMQFPEDVFPQALDGMSSADLKRKAKANYVKMVLPKEGGLKAIEKAIITSMMESHKPLIEIAKILMDVVAVVEDLICRFLGTSINVFGTQIGFPSRNPSHWNASLGYSQTITYGLRDFEKAFSDGVAAFDKKIAKASPLNKISGTSESKSPDLQPQLPKSLYVGYFDENGNVLEAPLWIRNHPKWFKHDYVNVDGVSSTISSPFEQLSPNLTTGTNQLLRIHNRTLASLDSNLASKTTDSQVSVAIKGLRDELDTILLEGTLDEESGTRSTPAILEEWLAKSRAAQLRHKYYPGQESTVVAVKDDDDEPVEPYVLIPTLPVFFNGKMREVSVPTAFANQIVRFSTLVAVSTLDLGDGQAQPFSADSITHFSHNPLTNYIPDNVKNYFLPHQWEEIAEYNIVNKATGAIIRTEQESVSVTLDIENDYELRLILVLNNGADTPVDSVPDINPLNQLKEGVINQPRDPRFFSSNYFWLVEANRKDDRQLASINNVFNPIQVSNHQASSTPGSRGRGKEWYGLLDKFTVLPMVFSRLVPILSNRLLPMLIKLIKLISNPSKISDLLLEVAITDKNISKLPQHFKAFGDGITEFAPVRSFRIPPTYELSKRARIPTGKYFYAGWRKVAKPSDLKPLFMLDGEALAEFGKEAFGTPLFSFGVKMDITNGNGFKLITSKEPSTDFTKPADVKEQPILGMILNFIKLPFETLFKIIMWILDWLKRIINPFKMIKAIIDFLTFKWLRDILGKRSLLNILGIPDPAIFENQMKKLFTELSKAAKNDKKGFSDEALDKYNEVFVYDLYRNGKYVKSEMEEHPLANPDRKPNTALQATYDDYLRNLATISGIEQKALYDIPGVKFGGENRIKQCGLRSFSINKLFPIPFWSAMPQYNTCEAPLIGLRPLQLTHRTLAFIQEILNAFLAMPLAIFGLEPTISIPKFGKEIPFADVFERLIKDLEATIIK